MPERRVARPEVVDGELDAQVLERVQAFHDDPGGADHHPLGQLEGEIPGGQARREERTLHDLDDSEFFELRRGEVHRHGEEVAGIPVPPLASLPARRVQRPGADPDDRPALFGDGQELRRCQPPGGMLPAQQRLETGQTGGGQGEDRLVVQRELSVVGRPAEVVGASTPNAAWWNTTKPMAMRNGRQS